MAAEQTTAAPFRRPSKTRDIRFTLRIKAKPERVYRALTSATELCRWWLEGAETDARNVGRFRMVWPKMRCRDGHRHFPPNAAVGESEGYFVDLEPGRKVAWMWKLPRMRKRIPPLASFFIVPRPGGCEVTLLHAGFSADPAADKHYEGSVQGWEDALAKLKLYLETGRTMKTQPIDFKALRALRARGR